jgi:CBS domain-containing protein
MSSRAACRLDALGFEQVHDYTAGIADWKAAGLPLEGSMTDVQHVADATRPDIPTALPDELLGTVWERTEASGWDEALVIDCEGVVVGRLRGRTWKHDADVRVVDLMESGPTTVRPNGALAPLVDRMEERGTKLVTVTDPQGVLIGVLALQDAQRLVTGEPPEEIWVDCDGCPGQWKLRPSNPTTQS